VCVSVHTHIVLHYQLVPLNFSRPKERDSWPEMYSAWPSIHLCVHVSPRRICCVFRPRKSTTKKWEGPRFLFFFFWIPRSFSHQGRRERAPVSQILLTDSTSSFIILALSPAADWKKKERKKQQLHSSPNVCACIWCLVTPAGVSRQPTLLLLLLVFVFPRVPSLFFTLHLPTRGERSLSLFFFFLFFPTLN
jgi:hypothetical protein